MKNSFQRAPVSKTGKALVEVLERALARDAGLTLEEWRALPEHEQIAIEERHEDSCFAKDQGFTLERYRAKKRGWIEEREARGEVLGIPQWLRDARAKERPGEQAVYYLSLTTEAGTATTERLKEISREVYANTKRGLILDQPATVKEMKARLLDEIERAGLSEWYYEAERQQAEGANS